MGYMVMRDSESTLRVHLSEISVLILETTAVSLTAALLNELTKEKIKVIFCDEKQNPSFEVVPYYGCHDCSLKLRTQLQWNETAKQAVWTAIVTQKIKQQAKNLAFFELSEEQLLQKYIEEIEFNLHSYFTSEELERFYKEIAYRDISLLLLEGEQNFIPNICEKVSVVDADFCEILAT